MDVGREVHVGREEGSVGVQREVCRLDRGG